MAKSNKETKLVSASATDKEVEYVENTGKKKKMEVVHKDTPGDWGPSYERRKAEVNKEANSRVIEPISHEIFKKTKEEKEEVKLIKAVHFAQIKNQGLDPKKTMNPTGNLFLD